MNFDSDAISLFRGFMPIKQKSSLPGTRSGLGLTSRDHGRHRLRHRTAYGAFRQPRRATARPRADR